MLSVLLLASAVAAGSPLSSRGLAELTDTGEILLLPKHQRQPFDGWLFSRTSKTCEAIETAMLDVDSWASHFDNMKSSKAKERTETTVVYELELKVMLAPTIYGKITKVSPGVIRFNDLETKAYSVYSLESADDGGCLIRYRIVEEKGKSSGWVSIMKGLEASAGDAGNYAAALSSARGFAKPETAKRVTTTGAAEAARVSLAGQGTMVEIDRSEKRPKYTLRRRVQTPFNDVSWSVRHKKGYADKTPVVKKADERGASSSYTIGGFGGRVSFTTHVTERSEEGGVLIVDERVTGGDISAEHGGWRWRIAPSRAASTSS